jgi:nucleotide-binding universal stress UspA family protein
MKNIIALVDFTRVSEAAIAQAGKIARTANTKLTLLHVAPQEDRKNEEELIAELNVSAEVLGKDPLNLDLHIEFGNFQTAIADILVELAADLVVIGTHGIRGIQRNLFSKNIAELMQKLQMPALVVQGQREQAPDDLDRWLLVGIGTPMLASLDWLRSAYNPHTIDAVKEDVESIETEALDEECNLIVYTGAGGMSVDLVLNSFGIPVLLV